jgi:hypothetical protein
MLSFGATRSPGSSIFFFLKFSVAMTRLELSRRPEQDLIVRSRNINYTRW